MMKTYFTEDYFIVLCSWLHVPLTSLYDED